MQRIPSVLIIGDEEVKNGTLSERIRGQGNGNRKSINDKLNEIKNPKIIIHTTTWTPEPSSEISITNSDTKDNSLTYATTETAIDDYINKIKQETNKFLP